MTHSVRRVFFLPNPYWFGGNPGERRYAMKSENTGEQEVIQTFLRGATAFSIAGTFKGIPISQKVKLLSFDQDIAVFQSVEIKGVAPSAGLLNIQCAGAPGFITGRLHGFNVHLHQLALKDLMYFPAPMVGRSLDRVHPEAPTYVTVHAAHAAMQVYLEDVNAGGMGVLAQTTPVCLETLLPDAEVKIDYRLPVSNCRMLLGGKIIYVTPIHATLVKIGIQLRLTAQQSHYLSRYVNFRKQAIMREIEQSYFRACEPRRVEDLYF
jgi:hypothetical protein